MQKPDQLDPYNFQAPVIQHPIQNLELYQINDAIAHLQIEISKKKDDSAAETTEKLRPLADRIYEGKMPERYRRPVFSKYNDETFEKYVMHAEEPKWAFDPGGDI